MGAVPQPRDLPEKDGRWSFPATLPHPRSTLAILPELDDGTAYLFWRALRRVEAWVDAPAELRRRGVRRRPDDVGAWRVAAAEVPELADAAAAFGALENDGTLIGAAQLADACGAVSEWAERRAFLEVTVQFAEAAARLEPESARRCNLAGRACRLASLWSRADHWYLRGVGLARQSRSMQEKFRAHLGAGAVAFAQGQYARAYRHYVTGGWAAQRCGNRRMAARAQHDLLGLAIERGLHDDALIHAARALEWYPKFHPNIPFLAHDFSIALTVRGQFRLGAKLAARVAEVIEGDSAKLLVLGTLARAAAGNQDHQTHAAARETVLSMISTYPNHAPAALYNLAEAARSRAEWEIATDLVQEAIRRAEEHGFGGIVRLASAAMKCISSRTPPATLSSSRDDLYHLEQITHEFMARVSRWRRRSNTTRMSDAPDP